MEALARLVIIFIFTCYSYNAFSFTKIEYSTVLDKSVQKSIDDERLRYQLPALSVSIKIPGENSSRNYVTGYNTILKNNKITQNTLFQIGSITKTFTATIIFKLIEDKKISLNDKLTKWLPQYKRWGRVTVIDLLRHTSGIYNYTHGNDFDEMLRNPPNSYLTLSDLTNIAYHHADSYQPGHKYNYTNTDYILLGMIIEKVSRDTIQHVFEKYIRQYNLNHTYYCSSKCSSSVIKSLAHGYNRDGTFSFNKDVIYLNLSFYQSAGGIISTPSDLVEWLNKLFNERIINNESFNNMTAIISPTNMKPINFQEMQSLRKKANPYELILEIGDGAGIGFVYLKDNGFAWVHAGGTAGYESFYAYNPCTGIYIAVMYNVKPKQQLVFIKIADNISKVLAKSSLVTNSITSYKQHNLLPSYCAGM